MRLFVAIWPPHDVLEAVARLERGPLAHGRWTTPDQWHVTLRFLGAVEAAELVVDALESTDLPSASVALGPVTRALGQRILCIPASGLDELAGAVRSATAHVGDPPDSRPFHGHLTLARLRAGRASAVAGAALDARFEVRDVAVVRSDLHPHGARYTTVATVPCTGP